MEGVVDIGDGIVGHLFDVYIFEFEEPHFLEFGFEVLDEGLLFVVFAYEEKVIVFGVVPFAAREDLLQHHLELFAVTNLGALFKVVDYSRFFSGFGVLLFGGGHFL